MHSTRAGYRTHIPQQHCYRLFQWGSTIGHPLNAHQITTPSLPLRCYVQYQSSTQDTCTATLEATGYFRRAAPQITTPSPSPEVLERSHKTTHKGGHLRNVVTERIRDSDGLRLRGSLQLEVLRGTIPGQSWAGGRLEGREKGEEGCVEAV